MKLIVCGSNGRMGTFVCRLAAENPSMEVVAGVDLASHGSAFPVFADINECTMSADVVISFLSPTAEALNLAMLKFCATRAIPLVLCTTGIEKLEPEIKIAAEKVAILRSGNMSLGINLLAMLLKRVSKVLHDSGFDIEITERHHNQKLDAPSGTALLLADAVNEPFSGGLRYVNDRSQSHEARTRDEIGLHALRGGTIIGEHSVVFAGYNEVVEFKHSAQSRELFAVGALKAAEFLRGKPAGLYSMIDVLEGSGVSI
ncbi:MAG: 4-hydroxy-tetrahydrodipicolinate reductase [Defluviitaleaceae bacterium]|nr:4-hydroxy-tetrahydrodipicolinate reductase [Defluviitaleaceae bacterium]